MCEKKLTIRDKYRIVICSSQQMQSANVYHSMQKNIALKIGFACENLKGCVCWGGDGGRRVVFGPENLLLSSNTQVSIDTNYNCAPNLQGKCGTFFFYVGLALASTVYALPPPPPPKKNQTYQACQKYIFEINDHPVP